jgi:nicotinamidase/pyrazinamidase
MNALILADIQNDFVAGGALAVPGGEEIVPLVNRLEPRFDVVVATQDWHPPDHGSFAANHPGHKPGDVIMLNGLQQILWPVHCVQHTVGAAFVPGFDTIGVARVFHKGTEAGIDSYSGFFDNGHRHSTGLADYLQEHRVKEVFVAGLTTDYCVKFTALDALRLGYKTSVIEDACRGVNLHPGDVEQTLVELEQAGVQRLRSSDFLTEWDFPNLDTPHYKIG